MGSVIDTLEVVFKADIAPLASRLSEIDARLHAIGAASGQASAGLQALGRSLDFSMAQLNSSAYAAGAAVGDAFARGLKSKKGAVDSAAAYLTSAALATLNKLTGAKTQTSAQTGITKPSGATVTGFTASAISGGADAAASAASHVTIPFNVDGVKLGEAVIRGMNTVSRMTGMIEQTV
ncbi:MAG: hypothetical protein ACOYI5_06085 [Christensenellales bacterium]|jgi:hypothetical protein